MDPTAFVYMALSGERECGCGAVVVDTAKCHAKYTKIDEIDPPTLRTQLAEQMQKNPQSLYILQRAEAHMHVFTYPRERAMQQLKDGTLPTIEEVRP